MRTDVSVEEHIRTLGFGPDLVPDLVRSETDKKRKKGSGGGRD